MPNRPIIANGISISWQAIVATIALAITLMAAGWGLFQTQFLAMDRIVSDNKSSIERMLTNLRRDMETDDGNLRAETLFLRNTLIGLRSEYVGQPEFKQFSKAIIERLDRLDKQLQVLEASRPTTGELQSTAKALDSQVSRIEDRVRALEGYIRGDPRPRPVDPTR